MMTKTEELVHALRAVVRGEAKTCVMGSIAPRQFCSVPVHINHGGRDYILEFWKRDQLMWLERAIFPNGACMLLQDWSSERWTPQPPEDFVEWTTRMAGFENATDQELDAELQRVIAAFSKNATMDDLRAGSVAHWRRFAFEPFHMLTEAEQIAFERLLKLQSAADDCAD